MALGLISEMFTQFNVPIPDRWRINGDDRVPPETTICLRALKILGLSSPGWRGLVGLASILALAINQLESAGLTQSVRPQLDRSR